METAGGANLHNFFGWGSKQSAWGRKLALLTATWYLAIPLGVQRDYCSLCPQRSTRNRSTLVDRFDGSGSTQHRYLLLLRWNHNVGSLLLVNISSTFVFMRKCVGSIRIVCILNVVSLENRRYLPLSADCRVIYCEIIWECLRNACVVSF